MYSNLKAEMVRQNFTVSDISGIIGTTEKTARDKINGKTEFSIYQAFQVRDKLFPSLSMEYLFNNNEHTA